MYGYDPIYDERIGEREREVNERVRWSAFRRASRDDNGEETAPGWMSRWFGRWQLIKPLRNERQLQEPSPSNDLA